MGKRGLSCLLEHAGGLLHLGGFLALGTQLRIRARRRQPQREVERVQRGHRPRGVFGEDRLKREFKGEIWEEWALTYGRNGPSERRNTLFASGSRRSFCEAAPDLSASLAGEGAVSFCETGPDPSASLAGAGALGGGAAAG